MAMILSPIEIRVLGVLIEKQMTQPAYYPMTLTAVTAACNQKSNRDPVMSLSDGEVGGALHKLQQWQLVSQAMPDRGSRSNRFQHEADKRFGWNTSEKAIMCELMIRGPQTTGELRTHAGRIIKLESVEFVRTVLGELERAEPKMVMELPRQTGQSATRFVQLLSGEPTPEMLQATAHATPATVAAPGADWREQITALEARVEALERAVAEFRAANIPAGDKHG